MEYSKQDLAGDRLATGHGAATISTPHCRQRDSVALLLRGEPFRWGCSTRGVDYQRMILASYEQHLAAPLEAAGRCLGVFAVVSVVFDADGSTGSQCTSALHAMPPFNGTRTRMLRVYQSLNQGRSLAFGLSWVLAHKDRFSLIVASRFDVRLHVPYPSWACRSNSINFASRCAVDDESSYEILSKCLDKSLIENAKQDADDLGPRLRS